LHEGKKAHEKKDTAKREGAQGNTWPVVIRDANAECRGGHIKKKGGHRGEKRNLVKNVLEKRFERGLEEIRDKKTKDQARITQDMGLKT